MNELIIGKKFVEIIRAIIKREDYQLKDINFSELFKFAKFHSLENMLYYGLTNNYFVLSEEDKLKIMQVHQKEVYKSAVQDSELIVINNLFEDAKIKHMFLKGSVIKYLYPSIDMRSMADLDILVDKEQLSSVTTLMNSLGYKTISLGGNHDVYHKLPFMNIEVHRDMISEVYDLSNYYYDIWDKVNLKNDKTSEYVLSDEDFFIYLLAHTAKHYGNGGTGIRSVLDIYIYLTHKDLDSNYLDNEFKKLGVYDFYRNIVMLAFVWFGNENHTEATKVMAEYIFTSGVYGVSKNADIKAAFIDNKDNIKVRKTKYLLKKIFPRYKNMKGQYPSLKYLPFLLPFYYIIRIVRIIFKGDYSKRIKSINSIDEVDINKIKERQEKTGY